MSQQQEPSFYESIKLGVQRSQETLKVIQFLKQGFDAMIYILAYPWLLMLRHNCGERFLKLFSVYLSLTIMSLFAMGNESEMGGVMVLLLIVAACTHYHRIYQRIKLNERWYSYSIGISWIKQYCRRYSQKTIDLCLEPLAVIVVGLIIFAFTFEQSVSRGYFGSRSAYTCDWFGVYMVISGFSLLIYQIQSYQRFRHMLLDRIDQQIIAENFSTIMNGESDPQVTSGFIVEGAESWTEQERETIYAALVYQNSENNSNSLQKSS